MSARPKLLDAVSNENDATFSPDGRWVAYVSDETGRNEVYVQPLERSGGKWQVSSDGGSEPAWSRSGPELFYRNGDNWMVVETVTAPSFERGKPRTLFAGRYETSVSDIRNYDATPDGEHLLLVAPTRDVSGESASPRIYVVLNWFEEFERLVSIDN